jgi:hypothetical protein
MDSGSIIDRAFTDGLNEAGDLYNNDRLDECIDKTRALLADRAIPRYHRMKALILLASTLGDWEEANDCHVEAETMWRVVRRWHPEGEDLELDAYMKDLRESLDEVGAVLEQTEPEDYDFENVVNDNVMAHEEHVKDVTASMRSLDMAEQSAASSGDEMDIEAPADVPAIDIDTPAEGAGETDATTQQHQADKVCSNLYCISTHLLIISQSQSLKLRIEVGLANAQLQAQRESSSGSLSPGPSAWRPTGSCKLLSLWNLGHI